MFFMKIAKFFIMISKLFSSTLFPFFIPSEKWNIHQNLTLFLRLCPFFRTPSCFTSEINLFLSRDPESSSWILFLLLVFYNLNLVLNIPSTNFLVKNSPFFLFLFFLFLCLVFEAGFLSTIALAAWNSPGCPLKLIEIHPPLKMGIQGVQHQCIARNTPFF